MYGTQLRQVFVLKTKSEKKLYFLKNISQQKIFFGLFKAPNTSKHITRNKVATMKTPEKQLTTKLFFIC